MLIEFTGRNIDVTPALKEHVREKLDHALRALEDVVGAHVILAVQKYRHIAEVLVKRRRGSLAGKAATSDMYQSIHQAIDRIEKQVRRKREKVIARTRRGGQEKVAEAVEVAVRTRRPARAERETVELQVVEESLDRVKPMDVEEAILLLEGAKRPFVAFRDAGTGRITVVYKRADGRFGLVAPRA